MPKNKQNNLNSVISDQTFTLPPLTLTFLLLMLSSTISYGGSKAKISAHNSHGHNYEEFGSAYDAIQKRRFSVRIKKRTSLAHKRSMESAFSKKSNTEKLEFNKGHHGFHPPYRQDLVSTLSARELGVPIRSAQLTNLSQYLMVKTAKTMKKQIKQQTVIQQVPTDSFIHSVHTVFLGVLPDNRLILRGMKRARDDTPSPKIIPYTGEHWSSIEIINPKGYINRVLVIDENHFLTVLSRGAERLHVWKKTDGKWSGQDFGHAASVSISPDKRMVTWFNPKFDPASIFVWFEYKGEWILEKLTDDTAIQERYHCVIPLSDGRVISSHKDGTLRVWHRAGGIWLYQELPNRGLDNDKLRLVEIDPNTIAVYSKGHIGIWNETNGQWSYTHLANLSGIHKIVLLQNGWLLSQPEHFFPKYKGIVLWGKRGGKWTQVTLSPHSYIRGVFLHEGSQLISKTTDVIQIWSFIDGSWESVSFPGKYEYTYIHSLSDGRFLSAGSDATQIKLWHKEAGIWTTTLLKRPAFLQDTLASINTYVKSYTLLNDGRLLGSFRHAYTNVSPDEPRLQRLEAKKGTRYNTRALHFWNLFPRKASSKSRSVFYERVESQEHVKYLVHSRRS
ncbi:WD40 repeat domain-containing protein [Sansalvadorimonas verongulae]|uniref:WD40 repeat domain-containing protein n=1 Tax=Sansalvadorimonas verongulae TaxID=2172824 RepID=UPI0012BC7261|nr:WD40 repeat domain-containing protein [Sansalvadorimonas verongulae]MTI12018.1 WD40 repeat domain-containing protein [Sansalvadorimonas verongulae]